MNPIKRTHQPITSATFAALFGVAMLLSGGVSLAAASCPVAPEDGCNGQFSGVSLAIDERFAGKERISARFQGGPVVPQLAFGDPVTSATSYSLCIYDAADQLAGELVIDKAGQDCGKKPCWRSIGDASPDGIGFSYKDRSGAADGVTRVFLLGDSDGESELMIRATNGSGTQPLGIAAALQGSTGATVQLLSSDSECFSIYINNVTRDDGLRYRVH